MVPPIPQRRRWQNTAQLALQALRQWTARDYLIATTASTGIALLIGWATVLIPNPVFTREIPPLWWNYPVWILTSAGIGMLIVTYIRTDGRANLKDSDPGPADTKNIEDDHNERRTSRYGLVGGVLAWFAVGCPVCNKIALLALGYTGAITWFAPIQPILALSALIFTGIALIWRLQSQVACPLPRKVAKVNQ